MSNITPGREMHAAIIAAATSHSDEPEEILAVLATLCGELIATVPPQVGKGYVFKQFVEHVAEVSGIAIMTNVLGNDNKLEKKPTLQ